LKKTGAQCVDPIQKVDQLNRIKRRNMSRSQESWNKKETEKKKQKKKKDKELKKQERKANSRSGSNLDNMIAYVDEFGNITSTPPDPGKKTVIREEDIEISVPKQDKTEEAPSVREGVVTFFNNSKGFGFIRDLRTQESIFVHKNDLTEPINEADKVSFEVERGPKGLNAVNVRVLR
jgi:cold shock CspA family protein